MDKRHDPQSPHVTPALLIEGYLDRLCAQLQTMPTEVVRETREELRQHLQMLVVMERDPQRVVQSALRQFGDPTAIGRRLALEWEEGQWSLSGLTLPQRIERIRAAGATELALAQPSPRLKVLNYMQMALLFCNVFLVMAPQGTLPGPHLPPSFLDAARWGIFGPYFVVGMIACVLEWQTAKSSPEGIGNDPQRVWRNILGRAGMAVLLPYTFLFPQRAGLASSAMIVLCLVMLVMGRQSSPRARLVVTSSMVYGLVMGLFIVTAMSWISFWWGSDSSLWMLLLPVVYFFGCWFWKHPQTRLSRRVQVLVGVGGVLIAGKVATEAVARHRARSPRTAMELVESWQWNGAYLNGDTDVAFMRAHPTQAIPALRSGLIHRNTQVRMETANTIEGLGDLARPLLPDLKSRFHSEDDQSIRIYLAMTFGGIGDTSPQTLTFLRAAFRREAEAEVKTYLAGSLARLTAAQFDPQAWRWLMDSIQPSDSNTNSATNPSFGALPGQDPFWQRRWAAAYVLQDMGKTARPALPQLRRLRDDASTPTWVSNKAKQAIQTIH